MSNKYKINKEKPLTTKPSSKWGDYMNYDIGICTEDKNELLNINIKVSSSLFKNLNLSRQILQNIFEKKVIEYLKENCWEVDSLEIETKMLCSPHFTPKNCIPINTKDELEQIKLAEIIL